MLIRRHPFPEILFLFLNDDRRSFCVFGSGGRKVEVLVEYGTIQCNIVWLADWEFERDDHDVMRALDRSLLPVNRYAERSMRI